LFRKFKEKHTSVGRLHQHAVRAYKQMCLRVDDGHVGQLIRLRKLYEACSKDPVYQEKLDEFETTLQATNPTLYADYIKEVLDNDAKRAKERGTPSTNPDIMIKQRNDYINRIYIKANRILRNDNVLTAGMKNNVIEKPLFMRDADRNIIKIKDGTGNVCFAYVDTLEPMVPTDAPKNYFNEITKTNDAGVPVRDITIPMSNETRKYISKSAKGMMPKKKSTEGWVIPSTTSDIARATTATAKPIKKTNLVGMFGALSTSYSDENDDTQHGGRHTRRRLYRRRHSCRRLRHSRSCSRGRLGR
jgi:hypothetical protein